MIYHFIIAGGGIAGLSTAIALQQAGFRVKVLERTKTFKEVGAGLGLGANAWKGLHQLGVTEDLESKCNIIASTKFLDRKGKILSELNINRLNQKYGVAYFTVHRADLQKVLVQHLFPDTVVFDKKVVDVRQNDTSVTVNLADGCTMEADALIAADGIHSAISKKYLPNKEPRFAGYTCWRAVVDIPKGNYEPGDFTETWGANGRFGIVPLTNQKLYWFACINAPFQSKEMAAYSTRDLLEQFKDYHAPIPEILRRTSDNDLIWNDIIDRKTPNRFAFNRTLLIGDAAHATTPNIGQGAGQAIEDAVILSNCLTTSKTIPDAFHEFERLRLPKTKKIVNYSWTIGRIAQIENPFIRKARNAIMQIMPTKIQENQLESIFQTDF